MGEYGTTINVDSPAFRRLTGDEAVLAQAITLRVQTRRGTYWDDPDYGTLVDDYLGAGLTSDALALVAAELKAEVEKDERVSSAAVIPSVIQTATGFTLAPSIKVFPLTGSPFDFTGPIWAFAGGALRKDA